MRDMRYIICSCCDNDFFHYLEYLAISVSKHTVNVGLHVVLVNVSEEKGAYLKTLCPAIEIEHDYIYFHNDAMKRGYCPNRKPSLMLSLMSKHSIPVLWVDADAVFTHAPNDDALVEILNKSDLSTILDEDHERLKLSERELSKLPHGPLGSPYYGIFLASVIGTNNSPKAKNLFQYIESKVLENPYAWFADQEALYLGYLKFKHEINFSAIPASIASEGNYNSIICFAKGPNKSGPYKDIGNTLIWNHFHFKENIKVQVEKIHLSAKIYTNVLLTYRLKTKFTTFIRNVFKITSSLTKLFLAPFRNNYVPNPKFYEKFFSEISVQPNHKFYTTKSNNDEPANQSKSSKCTPNYLIILESDLNIESTERVYTFLHERNNCLTVYVCLDLHSMATTDCLLHLIKKILSEKNSKISKFVTSKEPFPKVIGKLGVMPRKTIQTDQGEYGFFDDIADQSELVSILHNQPELFECIVLSMPSPSL